LSAEDLKLVGLGGRLSVICAQQAASGAETQHIVTDTIAGPERPPVTVLAPKIEFRDAEIGL
jgi:hypothetical protein